MNHDLLKTSDLPGSVWNRDSQSLRIPESLSCEYRKALKKHGLYEVALLKKPGDGAVGGIKDEDTKGHFATRFSGSVARIQLALLDPKAELGETRNTLLKAFSGGRIGLLDIPCGAGAGSIGLLTSIAALRESGVIPRQPLDVCIVSGDISDLARQYAAEVTGGVIKNLAAQGIFVHQEFLSWDVLDPYSNTGLIDTWTKCAADCTAHFVLVSNFSDFLSDTTRFKKADERLGEVFRWAARRNASVLWIEPKTKKAKGLLDKLKEWFINIPRLLWNDVVASQETRLASHCNYGHPVKPDVELRVTLSLLRLEASSK